jgi:hypothetical protein
MVRVLAFVAGFAAVAAKRGGAGCAIDAPQPGAKWAEGETHTITWSGSGCPTKATSLTLMKEHSSMGAVGDNIDGSSFDWEIGSDYPDGADYSIMLASGGENLAVTGWFSITSMGPRLSLGKRGGGGTCTIDAPAAGATWSEGEVHTISWSGDACPTKATDLTLMKEHSVVDTVATATDGSSFDWTVGTGYAEGADYSIMLASGGENLAVTGWFSITAKGLGITHPDLIDCDISSPASGNTYSAGEHHTIQWDGADCPPVASDLFLFMGSTRVATITRNVPGNEAQWTVQDGLTPNSNYFVVISDHETGKDLDLSDRFTIA